MPVAALTIAQGGIYHTDPTRCPGLPSSPCPCPCPHMLLSGAVGVWGWRQAVSGRQGLGGHTGWSKSEPGICRMSPYPDSLCFPVSISTVLLQPPAGGVVAGSAFGEEEEESSLRAPCLSPPFPFPPPRPVINRVLQAHRCSSSHMGCAWGDMVGDPKLHCLALPCLSFPPRSTKERGWGTATPYLDGCPCNLVGASAPCQALAQLQCRRDAGARSAPGWAARASSHSSAHFPVPLPVTRCSLAFLPPASSEPEPARCGRAGMVTACQQPPPAPHLD